MKDYKLLLAGLILLLLTAFIAIFTWLWTNNRKNTDPLPVMVSTNESATVEDAGDEALNQTLYIRAEKNLQAPLDDIIASFKSRYPRIQVSASYVPANVLLAVSKNEATKDSQLHSVFDTDIIIANEDLSIERIAPLQANIESTLQKENQQQTTVNTADVSDAENKDIDTSENNRKKIQTISAFDYAIEDEKALQGIILTDSTTAISFRNFLLSSTGQEILEKYNYHNINGYENSVNDLFKPTSRAKKATGDNPVDVADALSNGE
ncbi:hypothetical protein [Psychrobacter sp. NG27]|uniref:hypothetical protein n=1 Tax=Psychrobacter sp. NG27 TaxID=2781966 RepID=UPI0018DF01A0|nr:hypothetical protein [Psychrobacter sp. NG27]MBI0425042.1 hypothetical protein [Psychrobacter sp. NG27]